MKKAKEIKLTSVAPLVGAWIERNVTFVVEIVLVVAPLVGAWIESDTWDDSLTIYESLLL